ncbi:MAG: PhnD/SsuA/transferrin family substrate-binding protein [Planctomycetes bacterium]|nr:PhnD/SsuA/transferrin family substrate-binding protein [Planctomycetota bacterium]
MQHRPSEDRTAQILRAVTFLAPGIPREFFDSLLRILSDTLSCGVALAAETRSSGPMRPEEDLFRDGHADIGFVCSPSYVWLRSQPEPSIDLVPVGFVFRDPRHDGDPVYYSEAVVRADSSAQRFADLEQRVWGYNDDSSLSGYYATLERLASAGRGPDYFERWVRTGSHGASLRAIVAGEIDGAAIDSIALANWGRANPELRRSLRVVESWGPFPIQPVVARAALNDDHKRAIALALLQIDAATSGLAAYGFDGCVPTDDSHYDSQRRALEALRCRGK